MKLVKHEGRFRLFDPQASLLVMDERTLSRITQDPAQPLMPELEKGYSGEQHRIYDDETSLIDLCEQARERGARRMEVSYDFFFGGTKRTNYPDSPDTVAAYEAICKTAAAYGMSFSASVLSPLDVGGGFAKTHRQVGQTMQFAECAIGPDGAYRAELPLQTQWTNNKGPIRLVLAEARAYAFDEKRIGDTPYYAVDPNAILDISPTARFEAHPELETISQTGYGHAPLAIFGNTSCGLTRCLVVAVYKTPELDYFDEGAGAYMRSILDLHAAHGIRYAGFYSDEMHIQFDWDLEEHFGHDTEIHTRYITDSLARAYADAYGEEYRDFAKYLVYFSYHQHDFLGGEEGTLPAQHVLGESVQAVRDTWLLRKRYYDLLQRRVVDLCVDTKRYAEELSGQSIMARAHSTWQESPTCDRFGATQRFSKECRENLSRYDYTPSYQWSSSVRENMSACHDYFKWNEFLTGGGTDHPEGGTLDRCYYGAAFAASLAALNAYPFAYYGIWGSPREMLSRLERVGVAFGHEGSGHLFAHNLIQGLTPRVSDVLMIYPIDLNSVEERFGSWMVQYGYADYITEEQFDRHYQGTEDGRVRVKDRAYRAVCVLYAPLLGERALDALSEIAQNGAKVLWCAAPAQTTKRCEEKWKALFGVKALSFEHAGLSAPHALIRFKGLLKCVSPMTVPTDLLPDQVYPVEPGEAETCARLEHRCVGTSRFLRGGGLALYCGFRPRDDQSLSQGEDVHTLFGILKAMGAYAEDSLELRSRPERARYLMQRFPNGAVTVANHMRTVPEGWYGTFFRDAQQDAEIVKTRSLPPTAIVLDTQIGAHHIACEADGVLTYRLNEEGELVALAAESLRSFSLDGHAVRLINAPADVAWCLLDEEWLAEGVTRAYALRCSRAADLYLPLKPGPWQAALCGQDLLEARGEAELSPAKDGLRLAVRKPDTWYALWQNA